MDFNLIFAVDIVHAPETNLYLPAIAISVSLITQLAADQTLEELDRI